MGTFQLFQSSEIMLNKVQTAIQGDFDYNDRKTVEKKDRENVKGILQQ